jgi:hypothetical protein
VRFEVFTMARIHIMFFLHYGGVESGKCFSLYYHEDAISIISPEY